MVKKKKNLHIKKNVIACGKKFGNRTQRIWV